MTGGINSTYPTPLTFSHLCLRVQSLGFISRPHAAPFEAYSLLFYLCTPPLHLCLSCTHTQAALFSISVSLVLFFCLPLIQYKFLSGPGPSFLVSVCLSFNIDWSLALALLSLPRPFSFYSSTSPFGSLYLSHSGVQLSFIMFFRGELRKRLQPLLYLSFFLCFHSCSPFKSFGPFVHSLSLSSPCAVTSWAYAPVFLFSLFLILITNSNLITSILNNSLKLSFLDSIASYSSRGHVLSWALALDLFCINLHQLVSYTQLCSLSI